MRKLTLLSCALVVVGSTAQAQTSDSNLSAWYAMMLTPVGAFPAIETSAGGRTDATPQIAIRLATWKFKDDDTRLNNFGATWMNAATSPLRYGFTLGWNQPSGGGAGGNDGTLMLGAEAGGALWKSAAAGSASSFSLGWKGSGGYGRYMGTGGGNTWSLVGQVPLSWMYTMADKSMLSAYASGGFGFAGISDDTDSDSGTRPMFGLGGAWTSAGGVGVHLGGQQVPADFGFGVKAPWVMGLSVSFPVGGTR